MVARHWLILRAILLAAGPLSAERTWTVDAILNIPVLSDPQIRPDGRFYAYVRRSLEGSAWRSAVHIAPIASGAPREVAKGVRPRWSPDSLRLAYMDGQVHVIGKQDSAARAVTHSASPVISYSWTPDGKGIAYLAADSGPEPDPIVADRDYRYARIYLQSLDGGEPRRLTIADRHVVSFALSPDGRRAVYASQPTPRNRDNFDAD